MTQLSYAFSLFISLFLVSLPSLLAGILVSSGLLAFVDRQQLVAKFPRNRFLGAIVGSSLGMLVPVCLYGNLPVTRRLLVQGVPLSTAVSFLVAAPTVNPIAIAITWQAFPHSLRLVFLRVLLAWLTGIAIGSLFSTYPDKPRSQAEDNLLASRSTLLIAGTLVTSATEAQLQHRAGNLVYEYQEARAIDRPLISALRLFFENSLREFLELGSILALGCAIAVAVQAILPQAELLSWGQSPVQQLLVLLLLAPILSLGSVANAFFASSLSPTFLSGSLLAFLQVSSIFDLKGLGLFFASFRPKPVIYLLILSVQIAVLFSLLLDFYVN
jgi:uncharacterized membrane protein YraQ (UPF0718 family)